MRRKLVFKIRDFEEWYFNKLNNAIDTESYLSVPLFLFLSSAIVTSTFMLSKIDNDYSVSDEYDRIN